jgi:hypothetical protein
VPRLLRGARSEQLPPPLRHVGLDRTASGLRHRHPSLLPPLARHAHPRGPHVDVVYVQGAQLRHPEPRSVEELEGRAVPLPHRLVGRGQLAQRCGVGRAHHLRQRPLWRRDRNVLGGIRSDEAVRDGPVEHRPDRADLSRDRAPRQPPAVEKRDVSPQLQPIDSRESLDAPATEPLGELLQIPPVRGEGMGREITLGLAGAQERTPHFSHSSHTARMVAGPRRVNDR